MKDEVSGGWNSSVTYRYKKRLIVSEELLHKYQTISQKNNHWTVPIKHDGCVKFVHFWWWWQNRYAKMGDSYYDVGMFFTMYNVTDVLALWGINTIMWNRTKYFKIKQNNNVK